MKKKLFFNMAAAIICLLSSGMVFTSCSSDDDDSKKSEIAVATYSQADAKKYIQEAGQASKNRFENFDAASSQLKSLTELQDYYEENYKDYSPVNNTSITIDDIITDLKGVASGDIARLDVANKISAIAGEYKADEVNHKWVKTADATDQITVTFKDKNGKDVTGRLTMLASTTNSTPKITEARVYLTLKGDNLDATIGIDRQKGPYETDTKLKISMGRVLMRTDIMATASHRNTIISLSINGDVVASAYMTENGKTLNEDLAKNRIVLKRLTNIMFADKIVIIRSNNDVTKTQAAKAKQYASKEERRNAIAEVYNDCIKETWFDTNEKVLFTTSYEPATVMYNGQDRYYVRTIANFGDGTKATAEEFFEIADLSKIINQIFEKAGIDEIF